MDLDCVRCGVPLDYAGTEKFRLNGSKGGWKLLFGDLAEVGEELLPLEIHVCPQCRRVELRAPE